LFTAFWCLFFNFAILGWIGQKEVEIPFSEIGSISTIIYFFYFFAFLPNSIWVLKLMPIVVRLAVNKLQRIVISVIVLWGISFFPPEAKDPLSTAAAAVVYFIATSALHLAANWVKQSYQSKPTSKNDNPEEKGDRSDKIVNNPPEVSASPLAKTSASIVNDLNTSTVVPPIAPVPRGYNLTDVVVKLARRRFGDDLEINLSNPQTIKFFRDMYRIFNTETLLTKTEWTHIALFLHHGRMEVYRQIIDWYHTFEDESLLLKSKNEGVSLKVPTDEAKDLSREISAVKAKEISTEIQTSIMEKLSKSRPLFRKYKKIDEK
jgi:hypothetical protein